MPQSLAQAVQSLGSDPVVREALGPALAEQFISLKQDEWTAYARHVSPWEMARYAEYF